MKPLSLSLALFAGSCVFLDVAFGAYARTHYLPAQKLTAAKAASDGCLVYTGDSRMDAGVDPAALARALAPAIPCVVDLSIGGSKPVEQWFAMRSYLGSGRRPAIVLQGYAVNTLIAPSRPRDPDELIGNNAVTLAWSTASDVFDLYPGFPAAYLDPGLRFSLRRLSNTGSLVSLIWAKVRPYQDRVAGVRAGPTNRFGRTEDMNALGGEFLRETRQALAEVGDGPVQFHPFVRSLIERAQALGTLVFAVEVPMPEDYQRLVGESPAAHRVRAELRERLASAGGVLDVSTRYGAEDFEDGVHTNARGRSAFTERTARAILGDLPAARVRLESAKPGERRSGPAGKPDLGDELLMLNLRAWSARAAP